MNEGDLLVTALSLNFATTALREQAASAATVVDKVGGRLRGQGGWGGATRHRPAGEAPWLRKIGAAQACKVKALVSRQHARVWTPPGWSPVQVLPQAIGLVKSPLLQGGEGAALPSA